MANPPEIPVIVKIIITSHQCASVEEDGVQSDKGKQNKENQSGYIKAMRTGVTE
jgi:hypothetical protein